VTGFDWARLPLLALMLVLLVSGSVVLLRDQQSAAALVLLTAGMVVLGSWLTIETVSWYRKAHDKPEAPPQVSPPVGGTDDGPQ
jgi:hypothetical protein